MKLNEKREKHSLHGEKAAIQKQVLLKLFFTHTTDAPLTHERNTMS